MNPQHKRVLVVQEPEGFLHGMEDLDKCVRCPSESAHSGVDYSPALVVRRSLWLTA